MTTPRTAPGSPRRTCTRPTQAACDYADGGRETAADVLKEYFEDIGGRPEKPEKGTKRKGRASTAKSETGTPASTTKRSKTKEAPVEKAWSPPPGSWEHDVSHIDTVEENLDPKTGKDVRFAYLVWNNQKKTQHPLKHIYTKCPQKVSHLPLVPAANEVLTDASRCSNTTRATSCSRKTTTTTPTPTLTATPWTKPTRTTLPSIERLLPPAPTHHTRPARAARRTSSRHPTASSPSATQACSIWEAGWNSGCCWQ
jgi:hypothetical protein